MLFRSGSVRGDVRVECGGWRGGERVRGGVEEARGDEGGDGEEWTGERATAAGQVGKEFAEDVQGVDLEAVKGVFKGHLYRDWYSHMVRL